jgi:hypothetical protein
MNTHVYYGAKHLLYNVVKSQMPKTIALTNVLYDIYLIPYATFIHFKKKLVSKAFCQFENISCASYCSNL